MKISKFKMNILLLVVSAILIDWKYFSDWSQGTQALKKTTAKQQIVTPPAENRSAIKKPVEVQAKGFVIKGRAIFSGRGMKNINFTLTEYHSNGRVIVAGTEKTDYQGYYQFVHKWDESVVKYKIVPKHPDLSSGQGFSPSEKIFPPPSGNTNIDFTYNGPLPDLAVTGVDDRFAAIKNMGGLTSGPFKVKLIFECLDRKSHLIGSHQTFSLNGLAPGDSTLAFAGVPPDCMGPDGYILRAYSRVCEATADIEDQVFESNEDNNNFDACYHPGN